MRNAIVLFGAHWCAPCRAECRILPALAAAADPDRLVLAWIDRSVTLPVQVAPGIIAVLDPGHAQALALRIGGVGFGLPFTVVFDSDGRVCRIWKKPLLTQDISTLKAACQR